MFSVWIREEEDGGVAENCVANQFSDSVVHPEHLDSGLHVALSSYILHCVLCKGLVPEWWWPPATSQQATTKASPVSR